MEGINMINKASSKILKYICEYADIPSDKEAVYKYGIEITLSSIFNIVLVMISSILIGDILSGVIYLAIFVFLRSFTGGYHATTYLRCNATMVITFILTTILYRVIKHCVHSFIICGIISLICLLPIVMFAPVPNIHKPLDKLHKRISHNMSIIIAFILSLIGLMLLYFGVSFGIMIITTVAMVSVLIIVEIIMQRRGYHESE